MFSDAVINDKWISIFEGSREETKEWLRRNPETDVLRVCLGETKEVIPVSEYLNKF